MKRLFAAVAAALMILCFAGTAIAAPPSTAPGKNPLICSEALPENCTIVNKTSAVIDTRNGGGAAVYYEGFNSSWYGVKTSLVKDLSNTVTGDPLGIDPRWSIPIHDRTIQPRPPGSRTISCSCPSLPATTALVSSMSSMTHLPDRSPERDVPELVAVHSAEHQHVHRAGRQLHVHPLLRMAAAPPASGRSAMSRSASPASNPAIR